MRYKEKVKIPDISTSYKIINGKIVDIFGKKLFEKSLLIENEIIVSSGVSNFINTQQFLYFGNWTSEINQYIFSNKSVKKVFENFGLNEVIFKNKYGLIRNTITEIFSLFDLETAQIVKETGQFDFLIDLDYGIRCDYASGKRYVEKVHFDTKNILWRYDMNALPYISRYHHNSNQFEMIPDQYRNIVGVYDIEVWLVTEDYHLLVIDNTKGEFIHLFENVGNTRHCYMIDNKLVIFSNTYVVIDMKSKVIEKSVECDTYFPELANIRVNVSSLQGDYITFNADIKDQGYLSTVMGIFNYRTEKIEWVYEFTLDKKVSIDIHTAPILDNGKLFVLDHSHYLHEFERIA